MNFAKEQVPPELQVVLEMVVAGWSMNLSGACIEMLHPRLNLADEMKDLDVLVISKKGFLSVQRRQVNLIEELTF